VAHCIGWADRQDNLLVDSRRWENRVTLESLKSRVREIGSRYSSREERAQRLFVEERAASLHDDRNREYDIKRDIAAYFDIAYGHVCFCGSGQLGFSVVKEKLFEPAVSDLDAACIDAHLYQMAWIDIMETTRAFTDFTAFGRTPPTKIERLKDQILRRGMIRVEAMPLSPLKQRWSRFQGALSRRHNDLFSSITLAIYMNEYAFCWKQDSVLSQIIR
jgi:hypothetical protein